MTEIFYLVIVVTFFTVIV